MSTAKKYLRGAAALPFFLPLTVLAAISGPTGWSNPPMTPGPISSVNNGAGSVVSLINQILFWVSTAFWIAAGIFVFYAAYLYLTAGGNDEKVGKAHHQLIWAVVAIAVGLMAAGLPYLIDQVLRGQ